MPIKPFRKPARNRVRMLLVALAPLALAACQGAYFGMLNVASPRRAVAVEQGLVYDESNELRLDFYCPRNTEGAPLVVFFYGGRWNSGQRDWYAFVGRSLAARGIAVAVPDYRLFPVVQFPAFVEDAARAVAFAREHAVKCGVDTGRVFVAGHSAGAHIAALLGVDPRYLAAHDLASSELAGVIGIATPVAFGPFRESYWAPLFGDGERFRSSQPLSHVDGDEPPFLLLHGARDRVVPSAAAERFARTLRANGTPAEAKIYENIGHARILAALANQHSQIAPVLDEIEAFVGAPR